MHAWEHKQISNRLFSGTDKGSFFHYTRKCECQFDIDKLENERHEPFNLKGPWNMWRLIKEKKDPLFGGGFSLLSGQTVIGGYLPAVSVCVRFDSVPIWMAAFTGYHTVLFLFGGQSILQMVHIWRLL